MAQTPIPGEPEFGPQETGLTKVYGGGRHGLIAFRSLDEIAEAVKEINADYTRHSVAACESPANSSKRKKS